MPKLPIDYSQTIMYKIVCNDLSITDCYVGHTTNFIKRKNQHKTSCECETSKKKNLKIYTYIRQNGGWDNWSMIEIEKYSCNDVNEAKARERFLIEDLNSNLNIYIPTRNAKEYNDYYYKLKHNEILENQKKIYQKLKDKKREYYLAKKKSVDNV